MAVLTLAAALAVPACGSAETAAPRCESDPRLATVAQAVPDATFVPCVATLPPGWSVRSFRVQRGDARFSFRSDRSDQSVDVEFAASCDVSGATAVAPRNDGVRTYVRLAGIRPRYAGSFLDVFPGGCVRSTFDFERGAHLALTDELRAAIDLYPRRELRRQLQDDLGIRLDP